MTFHKCKEENGIAYSDLCLLWTSLVTIQYLSPRGIFSDVEAMRCKKDAKSNVLIIHPARDNRFVASVLKESLHKYNRWKRQLKEFPASILVFSGFCGLAAAKAYTVTDKMLPTLPLQATSPYYSYSSFNTLSPVAILYSAVAQLCFGLLRPTPWRLTIPPLAVAPTPESNDNNKVCIVTGSNTGIGLETAKSLVEQGYEVVLACRSRDKAMQALETIDASTNGRGKAVFVHPLDLSSFESVKEFSNAIKQKYKSIDVLVNNAGRNTSGKSEHNLDLCFQSNHLGHFLLTHELMDALLKDGGGRVVNLSSVMHHYADGGGEPHSQDYWKRIAMYDETREQSAYTPSKLAALLFSLELNRRYGSKGLRSIAVNPGAVNSDIWRNKPRWLVAIFRLLYLTSKQGSYTSVAAATEDFPLDVQYLQPYWLPKSMNMAFPPMEMLGPFQRVSSYSTKTPPRWDEWPRNSTALVEGQRGHGGMRL